MAPLRMGTPAARWVIAATVLGSGIVFVDGTVVNVALPTIGRDLDSSLTGLQWVVDSYLVSLTALLILGGSLGDLYGRRRLFIVGLIGFTASSLMCALAPTTGALVAARAVQGATGALLVPGSLAILSASFHPDDRGKAVGTWSGLAGISSAVGPFLGGWLIDAASWRWIFLMNLPLAAAAVAIAVRHVPESRDEALAEHTRPDFPGAALATLGLASLSYALIESAGGFGAPEAVAAVAGAASLAAFLAVERRARAPMLPLEVFRSRQFSGANATTLAVYGAFGGAMFLVVLELQRSLGYSPLEAGCSLLPITFFMLLFSRLTGAAAQRIGPRLPMTVGPLVSAAGVVLFAGVHPGDSYASSVLPAALVFGLGLSITVAPLTTAVLSSVEARHVGVGSAVNNAVARLAGLLAVALLPSVVDLAGADGPADFSDRCGRALLVAAAWAATGGVIAWFTISGRRPAATAPAPPALTPAFHPCLAKERTLVRS